MIVLIADIFLKMLRSLQDLETVLGLSPGFNFASSFKDRKESVESHLTFVEKHCLPLKFEGTLRRTARIRQLLRDPKFLLNFDANATRDLATEIRVLREAIEDDLKSISCFFLPREQYKHWQQPQSFSKQVSERFSKAQTDIISAGRCFAVEEYTACVFHLMRVAERGLRTLANHLDVTLKHDIVLEEWDPILQAVDRKLRDLHNEPRTTERESDLRFYSEAANQFRYFKDTYRNYVSHSRDPYDEGQAESVMNRVGEFMADLATKLSDADQ
jgi:hypothetical protein